MRCREQFSNDSNSVFLVQMDIVTGGATAPHFDHPMGHPPVPGEPQVHAHADAFDGYLIGLDLVGKTRYFCYKVGVTTMAISTEKQALARIYGRGRGWAFSQKDFADLASRKAIDMALMRLADKGTIRRVIRGIYDYPRHSDLLKKQMGPDIHQVARALARKFGWRIQPSGATALNLLGLSTQVPGRYVYQTDGPRRTYAIGRTTLSFQHAALKEAGFRHEESGVIVAALKALGQDRISDETIEQIRRWLATGKRKAVLKDTKRVTGWVYAAIQHVCREGADG